MDENAKNEKMKSLNSSKVVRRLTNASREIQFSSAETLKTKQQGSEGPTAAPVFDNAMDENAMDEKMKSLDSSKVMK
jgi:hypothetical protein